MAMTNRPKNPNLIKHQPRRQDSPRMTKSIPLRLETELEIQVGMQDPATEQLPELKRVPNAPTEATLVTDQELVLEVEVEDNKTSLSSRIRRSCKSSRK
jgi:hypothetical protein